MLGSPSLRSLAITIGLGVVLGALVADAKSYYDEDHALTPHDEVLIKGSFLAQPNATTFALGDPIVVLFAVQNNAKTRILMEGVKAHLHSPFKYHNHIQNFTSKAMIGDVSPGQTKTYSYQFRPHPNLLPISYRLAIDTTYSVEGEPYLSTFYNNTISLYEKPMEIDAGFVIQAAIAAIGAGVGVFALISLCKGQSKSKRRRTTASVSDWQTDSSSKQKSN